jgi:hypothetical protein
MSITVELGPEFEERLWLQAAAQGLPVQEYVEGLIRRAANALPGEQPTLAEFEADWAGFADGLDPIAPLPEEAFSREAMYGERD